VVFLGRIESTEVCRESTGFAVLLTAPSQGGDVETPGKPVELPMSGSRLAREPQCQRAEGGNDERGSQDCDGARPIPAV
jgi:hypothetical protein